ncbi:glycosyltransferase family 2 protein [Hymenobacter lapidiphilus]|uniref:Glycosyltransferase n=1 Tax=Hymenobacter lapidiphilus TaxID=2608003 RepID=A0A7Y7PR84_9BACT|nr:glycosyltransferase [Hymenobacter lapidiphilus]NVO32561.1 glycosyltransferase [Hymenobacter lapidiphilus]
MGPILLSIVTWNSAAVIEACLAACLAQTYPDFTIWVVDNNSADDTCARVAAVAATDGRVQLHRLARNTGFCGGHNYALDHSTSEAVLLVNPDVEMAPDYLSRAAEALAADAAIGTVCGLLLQSRAAHPRIDSAGLVRQSGGRFTLRHHGRLLPELQLITEDVDGADGALPLYRRAFINDLRVEGSFFDERFFAHKEDWDIAWRGQLYGWRTVFEPRCRALHPRVFLPADLRSRLQLGAAIKADAVKNQWLLLLKNPPTNQLAGLWLRALPRQLGVLLYCLLLERPSLRAYRYVWQHRASIWASRLHIQQRAGQGLPAAARFPTAASGQIPSETELLAG